MNAISFATAQSDAIEPEDFQLTIIENMARALLRQPSPPCLLRAPTGAGKTFILSQVLQRVSAERPMLWLWFVPFVNLVQQTEDALLANCAGLSPTLLAQGRNQETRPGLVLLSTAQAVARAKDRKAGYDADADDDTRSLAALVARARSQGLGIGLVVDEAHIALEKETEFGKFAQWLEPEILIMATATPKDERLLEFLKEAGMSSFESFSVNRDEVVKARLNKQYIEAVIYDLGASMRSVADLKRTVLRQAWRRSQKLKRQLAESGIPLTPLLLVQVANGGDTVEEAERDLMELCKVHPAAIGKHTADAPDPGLMSAVANDPTKEVLIFKQSAGTGFDAPRAFVLASTKPVNDADFAMQFIGRIMRVARPVRAAFPRPEPIPADLDTAYVYLANAEAQRGFEAAVSASRNVQSQLEGQTEKLEQRKTQSGATVLTNRKSQQLPVDYKLPLPGDTPPPPAAKPQPQEQGQMSLLPDFDKQQPAGNDDADGLDEVLPRKAADVPKGEYSAKQPESLSGWREWLENKGIRPYPLRKDCRNLPAALQREKRPEITDMGKVSRAAAERLKIGDDRAKSAVKVALNRLKEKEIHTELTKGERREEDVRIITDRNALAQEARKVLRSLPHVEEEDMRVIVSVLAGRLRPAVEEAFEDADDEAQPSELELQRLSRDAAHWVIKSEGEGLRELMQSLIAEFTTLEEAEPLPDWMLFPAELSLAASRKNIYGVMPPSDEDLGRIDQIMLLEDRQWLDARTLQLAEGRLRTARFDGAAKLNGEELVFARALDRADFVVWWHRNPDKKGYSVRLVRGDHHYYFHPDFVVCIEHYHGDEPLPRLIETKENVKDAARKALRVPRTYGKVLFLTKDQNRLRVVKEDGGLGIAVEWDDLTPIREWLRETKPLV